MTKTDGAQQFLEAINDRLPDVDISMIPEEIEWKHEVEAGMFDGNPLLVDTFSRREPAPTPQPAVILLHGGDGRGRNPTSDYWRHFTYLALKYGIFGVCATHRVGSDQTEQLRFPGFLEDMKCIARWVRAKAAELNVDPHRVAGGGGSFGAYTGALMGLTADEPQYKKGGHEEQSDRLDLMILLNGCFDWALHYYDSRYPAPRAAENTTKSRDAALGLFGGSPGEASEGYCQASPIQLLTRRDIDVSRTPPALILHPDGDNLCNPVHSVIFDRLMREHGLESELEIVPGGMDHGWFWRPEGFLPVTHRIEKFLCERFDLTPLQ